MLDASQAIMSAVAAENNLLIRTKAAWSLANLCDALPRLSDPLPNEMYSQLLQTSIKACLDTDKVMYTHSNVTNHVIALHLYISKIGQIQWCSSFGEFVGLHGNRSAKLMELFCLRHRKSVLTVSGMCDQHIQPAMKAMAHCINIGAAKVRCHVDIRGMRLTRTQCMFIILMLMVEANGLY